MTTTCANPGTIVSDSSNGGATAWTNPGNAASSDNVYATNASIDGEITERLKATNFSFSIPTGATIDGISVHIEKKCSANSSSNNYRDNEVKLVKGGTVQAENKAITTAGLAGRWATTDTVYDYGSSSDLWSTTWTVSDINGSGFGVIISADDSGDQTGSVDHIQICITYTAAPSGNTYDEIAAGGATAGGVGFIEEVYDITATGGTTAGGVSELPGNTYDEIASGGSTAGGVGFIEEVYDITAAGGATAGGVSELPGNTYDEIASGGATAGGVGFIEEVYDITATGGTTAGGVSIIEEVYDEIAAGGATAGGLGELSGNTYDEIASGGATAGGVAFITHDETAAGGATAGGAALITHDETATGGATAGGSNSVIGNYNVFTNGGSTSSGSAVIQIISIHRIDGTGGIVIGGHVATLTEFEASGGIETGGSAYQTYNETITGGAEVGGEISLGGSTNIFATGGETAGGAALNSKFELSGIRGSGGATTGGEVTTTGTFEEIASGGGLAGGSIFLNEIISADGGAIANGLATVPAIYNIIGSGGGVIGGEANEQQCISSSETSDTESAGIGTNNSSFSGVTPDYVFNSPGNITSSNDTWATAIMTINPSTAGWLICKNFGLEIPSGSTINGIQFDVERSASRSNRIYDAEIRILKGGTIVGNDKAQTGLSWPTSDTIRSYGNASDLWGTTWTEAELQDSEFGLAIKVTKIGLDSNIAARVDHVRVTVTFVGGFSNCTLNVTASGGAVCSGTVPQDPIPEGGVVCSAEVEVEGGTEVIISSVHPLGRIDGGGTSAHQMIFFTPSYNGGIWGGIKIGSGAFLENFYNIVPTGGAVLGGQALIGEHVYATGGAELTGTSDNLVTLLTTGGITASGTSTQSVYYYPRFAGTGVIFGSKIFIEFNGTFHYFETSDGGIRIDSVDAPYYTDRHVQDPINTLTGGDATLLQIFVGVPEGSATINGTSTVEFTANSNGTGGATTGGIAPIYENFISTGGAKIGGTGRSNINYTTLSQSPAAVEVSGAATVKNTLNIKAAGGGLLSGVSTSYRLMRTTASGGGIVSGKILQIYKQFASGGATGGGVAVPTLRKITDTSGGVVAAGEHSATFVWYISAVDGAKLGGTGKVVKTYDIQTILTQKIGTLLASDNIFKVEERIRGLFQIQDGPIPENDETAPRANDNAKWCSVETRCDDGVLPKTSKDRQSPYIPSSNEIEV